MLLWQKHDLVFVLLITWALINIKFGLTVGLRTALDRKSYYIIKIFQNILPLVPVWRRVLYRDPVIFFGEI